MPPASWVSSELLGCHVERWPVELSIGDATPIVTELVRRLAAMATPALIDASPPFMASMLDGYPAMGTHVLVRFGRWRALATLPGPDDPSRRPISAAMHAYGQGVAGAALGHVEEAEAARSALDAAAAAIPKDAIFLSNTVRDIARRWPKTYISGTVGRKSVGQSTHIHSMQRRSVGSCAPNKSASARRSRWYIAKKHYLTSMRNRRRTSSRSAFLAMQSIAFNSYPASV